MGNVRTSFVFKDSHCNSPLAAFRAFPLKHKSARAFVCHSLGEQKLLLCAKRTMKHTTLLAQHAHPANIRANLLRDKNRTDDSLVCFDRAGLNFLLARCDAPSTILFCGCSVGNHCSKAQGGMVTVESQFSSPAKEKMPVTMVMIRSQNESLHLSMLVTQMIGAST